MASPRSSSSYFFSVVKLVDDVLGSRVDGLADSASAVLETATNRALVSASPVDFSAAGDVSDGKETSAVSSSPIEAEVKRRLESELSRERSKIERAFLERLDDERDSIRKQFEAMMVEKQIRFEKQLEAANSNGVTGEVPTLQESGEQKIAELTNALHASMSQCEDAQKAVIYAQNEAEKLQQAKARLEQDFRTLAAEKAEAVFLLEEAREQQAGLATPDFDAKIQQLEKEKISLMRETDEAVQRALEFQAQTAVYQTQLSQINQTILAERHELDELRRAMNSKLALEIEIEALKKQLDQRDALLAEMKTHVEERNVKLERVGRQIEDGNSQTGELEALLEEERKSTRRAVEERNRALEDGRVLAESLSSVRESVDRLNQEREEMQQRINDILALNSPDESERVELLRQIGDQQRELDRLASEHDLMALTNQRLEAKVAQLMNELETSLSQQQSAVHSGKALLDDSAVEALVEERLSRARSELEASVRRDVEAEFVVKQAHYDSLTEEKQIAARLELETSIRREIQQEFAARQNEMEAERKQFEEALKNLESRFDSSGSVANDNFNAMEERLRGAEDLLAEKLSLIGETQAQLADKTRMVSEMQSQLNLKIEMEQILRTEVDAKSSAVTELETRLHSMESKETSLRNELLAKDSALEKAEAEIIERLDQIDRMKTQNEEAIVILERGYNSQKSLYEQEIARLSGLLAECESQLSSMRREMQECDAEWQIRVSSLQTELDLLRSLGEGENLERLKNTQELADTAKSELEAIVKAKDEELEALREMFDKATLELKSNNTVNEGSKREMEAMIEALRKERDDLVREKNILEKTFRERERHLKEKADEVVRKKVEREREKIVADTSQRISTESIALQREIDDLNMQLRKIKDETVKTLERDLEETRGKLKRVQDENLHAEKESGRDQESKIRSLRDSHDAEVRSLRESLNREHESKVRAMKDKLEDVVKKRVAKAKDQWDLAAKADIERQVDVRERELKASMEDVAKKHSSRDREKLVAEFDQERLRLQSELERAQARVIFLEDVTQRVQQSLEASEKRAASSRESILSEVEREMRIEREELAKLRETNQARISALESSLKFERDENAKLKTRLTRTDKDSSMERDLAQQLAEKLRDESNLRREAVAQLDKCRDRNEHVEAENKVMREEIIAQKDLLEKVSKGESRAVASLKQQLAGSQKLLSEATHELHDTTSAIEELQEAATRVKGEALQSLVASLGKNKVKSYFAVWRDGGESVKKKD